MELFRKAPISIAVAATVALSGCLGGGGGGGGGAGGGEGQPPAADVTNYTLAIETPDQTLVTHVPASNTERLLSAVINALMPPAFAQALNNLPPDVFRVEIINGDDNGTPDDPSDDKNRVLQGGDDFTVTQDGDKYVLGLPFSPQVNSFIGVEVSPGMEFTVLTHAESLVANPVTTFVTRMISSYAGQLDELSLEEVDELIEDVLELAADETIQAEILKAYQQSTDTEELMSGIAAQLAATIETRVDEAATPPLAPSAASQAVGDYHFMGLSVGAYSNSGHGGLLLGGHNNNAALRVNGDAATLSPDGQTLEFEAVYPFGGTAVVRVEQLEDDPSSIAIDSRGLLNPESESVSDYQKGSSDVAACESTAAACRDREYSSAIRMLAAGPAEGRFNTLIGSSYNDREVTTGEGAVALKVVGGFLDFAVRKPSAPIELRGDYGTLEYTMEVEHDDPDTVDFEAWLVGMHYGSTHVSYCNTSNLDLEVFTSTLAHGFERMDPDGEACLFGQGQHPYELDERGRLTIPQPEGPAIEGWVSADGLTILMTSQDPDEDDLTDDYAEVDDGSRAVLISVKLDEQLNTLANRRYRLFGLALDGRSTTGGAGAAGLNRFLAGTLEFDAAGKAAIQTSVQGELAALDGVRFGFNNLQQSFEIPAASITLGDGVLSATATLPGSTGSAGSTLTLEGFVQEGGRVLLLNRHLAYGTGDLLGPVIAVCTNCD